MISLRLKVGLIASMHYQKVMASSFDQATKNYEFMKVLMKCYA